MYFSGLGYADASSADFAYLVRNHTLSTRIAVMSPDWAPSPAAVGTGLTALPKTIPAATSLGPVPDVGTAYNTPSSLPPNFSQAESPLSRLLFTGACTQSPSSRTVDGPQPSTSSCSSSGGPPSQVCASLKSAPVIPSSALVTPSSSDIFAGPLITITPNPAQPQSQTNASSNQGSYAISVGLIVGLILLGVFLAGLVCFILRYRRRTRRRRIRDPLIDSVLPLGKAILSPPGIAEGVESRVSSLPPPRTSFDSGPPGAPSVSACSEVPYAQLSNSCKSTYSKDFRGTGLAL